MEIERNNCISLFCFLMHFGHLKPEISLLVGQKPCEVDVSS